jgi:microcystin-dependent protein
MAIQQNSALFALLGTIYGGDGKTTFGLPNLGGRLPLGAGESVGTSRYMLGETGGTERLTLLQTQMPVHTHGGSQLSVTLGASTSAATSSAPGDSEVLAATNGQDGDGLPVTVKAYAPSTSQNTTLHGGAVSGMVDPAGGSQPIEILQPFQAINFVICLQGIFPSRN